MMTCKHYEILSEAAQEFKEAQLYYKLARVKGLSTRFRQAVNAAIKQILKNPGAYAIRYNDVRIAYTETLPYAIHFTVGEGVVYIIAIIYESRESGKRS